jgi:predicted metal-dependent HD superfamily phosphohydrolase
VIDDLRDRWDLLALDIGMIGPASEAAIGDVLARHAEPHRRYHSIEHLVEVHAALDELATAGAEAADDVAVRFAAWFHDAIYDPTADDNEAASADLAVLVLEQLGVEPEVRHEVADLIRMTSGHDPADANEAAAALSDADLSILAAAPERYVRYRRQVRAEYAHLDDAQWLEGRTSVLEHFLDREHLFWTVDGRLKWEATARSNLRAEREILSRGP